MTKMVDVQKSQEMDSDIESLRAEGERLRQENAELRQNQVTRVAAPTGSPLITSYEAALPRLCSVANYQARDTELALQIQPFSLVTNKASDTV